MQIRFDVNAMPWGHNPYSIFFLQKRQFCKIVFSSPSNRTGWCYEVYRFFSNYLLPVRRQKFKACKVKQNSPTSGDECLLAARRLWQKKLPEFFLARTVFHCVGRLDQVWSRSILDLCGDVGLEIYISFSIRLTVLSISRGFLGGEIYPQSTRIWNKKKCAPLSKMRQCRSQDNDKSLTRSHDATTLPLRSLTSLSFIPSLLKVWGHSSSVSSFFCFVFHW